jgi:hypothetical protein
MRILKKNVEDFTHFREMPNSRKEGGMKLMPVFDVRDQRKKVEMILKQRNVDRGSKYFKPSYSVIGYSYNSSMKK